MPAQGGNAPPAWRDDEATRHAVPVRRLQTQPRQPIASSAHSGVCDTIYAAGACASASTARVRQHSPSAVRRPARHSGRRAVGVHAVDGQDTQPAEAVSGVCSTGPREATSSHDRFGPGTCAAERSRRSARAGASPAELCRRQRLRRDESECRGTQARLAGRGAGYGGHSSRQHTCRVLRGRGRPHAGVAWRVVRVRLGLHL
mmetsp:Transcript_55447/g.112820  ORF Transcript_55447/g.112820 Transcript_55447/m.112820 type:complete len:202 (-) Transcript_55447:309-914(-)